jgi:hypothetical protein
LTSTTDSPRPRRRRRARAKAEPADGASSLRRRLSTAVAATAGVVGLLVGLTTLVDWIGDKLDDPQPPPPPEIDNRIAGLRVRGTGETLEDYLRDTGQSLRGLSDRRLREEGVTFVIRVRLKGAVGERFPLRLTVYNRESGERLGGGIYDQVVATFTPSSRNHARSVPLWMPYPPQRGEYFVRATLTDAKRRPVDERDSPPFEVTEVPSLEGDAGSSR